MYDRKTGKYVRARASKIDLEEISGVDTAAQGPGGARVLLMKRGNVQKSAWMTSSEDGHSHLVDDVNYEGLFREAGETTWQTSAKEKSGMGHTHPWMKNPDGTITIGDADGHTHTVLDSRGELSESLIRTESVAGKAVRFGIEDYALIPDHEKPTTWSLRLAEASGGPPSVEKVRDAVTVLTKGVASPENVPENLRPVVIAKVRRAWQKIYGNEPKDLPEVLKAEDHDMDPELKKKLDRLEEIEKKLTALEADLVVAKAYGALPDAAKAYHAGLTEDEQAAFMKMDTEARTVAMKKAADSDEVVELYGRKVRKSVVGEDSFHVMKEQALEIATEKAKTATEIAKREAVELEKRASVDIPNLPGDAATHIELMRAVTAIENEEVRKSAGEALRGANEAMVRLAKMEGRPGGGDGDNGDVATLIEKGAKKIAEAKSISIEKAKAEFLETDEGGELYARYDKEKMATTAGRE